jgi:hypothetical protein
VTFIVYGRRIQVAAEVRWKKDNLLGIRFLDLSDDDREGIRLFVMEESFDYIESILG